MPDVKKVIKELESLRDICNAKSNMAIGNSKVAWTGYAAVAEYALDLLKEQEQEPKPIVNKWHKNPLGDYSRLHCPWCDRELDMQSAKEFVACPYCGRPVKWNENP